MSEPEIRLTDIVIEANYAFMECRFTDDTVQIPVGVVPVECVIETGITEITELSKSDKTKFMEDLPSMTFHISGNYDTPL